MDLNLGACNAHAFGERRVSVEIRRLVLNMKRFIILFLTFAIILLQMMSSKHTMKATVLYRYGRLL